VCSWRHFVNKNFRFVESYPAVVWLCCGVNEDTEYKIYDVTMRNMEEIRNPALRNRPTEEHTKEVLEIIRKRAVEDLKNSNVHLEEALLRRASVTRPNEPLPSIRVDNDREDHLVSRPQRRSCPADLDSNQAETSLRRWRSLSDAPLLDLRNRSPRDRALTSPASDTSATSRHGRPRRMSNNLPPLESKKERFERPNCIPSIRKSGVLLLSNEAIDINHNYETEDVLTENGTDHSHDWT